MELKVWQVIPSVSSSPYDISIFIKSFQKKEEKKIKENG